MVVAAPRGKTMAASNHASKHHFSFGAAAGVAALAFVAVPEDNRNERSASGRQPPRHAAKVPLPDFDVPRTVQDMDKSGSLDLGRPWSPFAEADPFAEDGAFDLGAINDYDVLADARRLKDLPDDGYKQSDNMIGVSFDALFDVYTSPPEIREERYQNGFGADKSVEGRYFHRVIHTQRRNEAFHASNVYRGPTPAMHGLPYSYAKKRKGRRHHFAEVYISTSIVARELQYDSPMQYVESRGWSLSKTRKLQYTQIRENIFEKATGASHDLQVGFRGMVNRLYEMIEKDGLRDPFTGKPAVNFLDKNSFIQKLYLHIQEFQMATIIVKEFFIQHVPDHKDDIDHWVKLIFQTCIKRNDLVKMFNNIFSLFPNGDDPSLAKQLLTNPDAMRDLVSSKANDINFQIQYSNLVEEGLKSIKQRSRKDTKPSPTKHIVLCRARARDWNRGAIDNKYGRLIPSSTLKYPSGRATSGEKRNRPGKSSPLWL